MTPKPEELRAAILDLLRADLTTTVPVAARALGRSPHRAYEDIRRTGKLAGIAPIRLSQKSLRIPTRPLLALLGEMDEEAPRD